MLYGVFQNNVLKKMDEFSARGVQLSTTKTADYLLRIDGCINDYLDELAMGAARISATYKVVQNPVDNESSYDTSAIKLQEPSDDDATIEMESALSYYYEATGPSETYIEEYDGSTWNILSSASLSSTVTAFSEVMGLITAASSTTNIRIRFTSDYPFSYRNEKLYDCTFSTSTSPIVVQQHRPIFRYELPSDFLMMDSIEFTDRNGNTRPFSGYVIYDTDNTIGFSRYDVGSFEINYFRKPMHISTAGASTETVDCLDMALASLTMSVAAEVMATENIQLSAFYYNLFEGKKSGIMKQPETRQKEIENVTGW